MEQSDNVHRAPPLKCAVFVDHDNFVYDQDRCGIKYDELMKYIESQGMIVVRATTYLAVDTYKEENDKEYKRERKGYRDQIRKSGFKVFTKNIRYFSGDDGRMTMKGNVDLDLAVDALLQTDNVDCVYIGTGDGDFLRVVTALQNKGKRVICFGIENIANMLRDVTDRYICLRDNEEVLRKIFPTFKSDEDKIKEHQKKKFGSDSSKINQLSSDKVDLRTNDTEAFKKKIEKAKRPSLDGAITAQVPELEYGVIQRWWFDKGFGFIKPDKNPLPDGKGVYFHVTNVKTVEGIMADNGRVEDHYMRGRPVQFRRVVDGHEIYAVQMFLVDELDNGN